MTTISTTTETVSKDIEDFLNQCNGDELVSYWNIYCSENDYMDDYIHENNEDFFATYFGTDIMAAVRAVCYGEYNFTDDYVIFNGYGNLDSFDKYCVENHIDSSSLISDIEENPERYDIEIEIEDIYTIMANNAHQEYIEFCENEQKSEDTSTD